MLKSVYLFARRIVMLAVVPAICATGAMALDSDSSRDDGKFSCPFEEQGISGVLNIRYHFYTYDRENTQERVLVLVSTEREISTWRRLIQECGVLPTLDIKGTAWKVKLRRAEEDGSALIGRVTDTKQSVFVMTTNEASIRYDDRF